MKKLLVLSVVIVMLLTGCSTTIGEAETKVLSNEELMNEYVVDNFGGQYYGILDAEDDNDYIMFVVYDENDMPTNYVAINSEYYQSINN